MPRLSVIAIGNELLDGKIVDANAAFLAQELRTYSTRLQRVIVVGDQVEEIHWALKEAVASSDLVITSGGLGPTTDDLTRGAIAAFCGVTLEEDASSRARLIARFERRGVAMNPINLRQCFFPAGAAIFPNTVGTADAFHCRAGAHLIALPGIPAEFQALTREMVLPWIRETYPDCRRGHETDLHCFGLSESHIGGVIEQVGMPPEIQVGYRPVFPEIWVTLRSQTLGSGDLSEWRERIEAALGPQFVFASRGTVGDTLGELLEERDLTLGAAESCTGGLIADRIVTRPGSSRYFFASLVTYGDRAKSSLLGVPTELLQRFGAVSAEVASSMAEGVRERVGAAIGVSVTGIAGPTGGTEEKPVGSVFFGLADERGTEIVHRILPLERNRFRLYCATLALDLVRRRILGFPLQWERR